jgi:hypothetical protein
MWSFAPLARDEPMSERNSIRTLPDRTEADDEAAIMSACCLDERQRAFATAILDPDSPIPRGLIGPDGEPGGKRFAVYRNNVVS